MKVKHLHLTLISCMALLVGCASYGGGYYKGCDTCGGGCAAADNSPYANACQCAYEPACDGSNPCLGQGKCCRSFGNIGETSLNNSFW